MLWWLVFKIIGVIMIVAGGFLVVFFPGVPEHQEAGARGGETAMGIGGIVLGILLIIIGGFILFSP